MSHIVIFLSYMAKYDEIIPAGFLETLWIQTLEHLITLIWHYGGKATERTADKVGDVGHLDFLLLHAA